MRPNIFSYATSELSQDAFLCWLLSWAGAEHAAEDSVLHALGGRFLTDIYKQAKKQPPVNYNSVEVRRQVGGIDILCVVNGATAILIEDKVGAQSHSDQLARYRKHAEGLGFAPDQILAVYLQTGDQSDYTGVKKEGYVVYQRPDLLSHLECLLGTVASERSDIVSSYTVYLQRIEAQVQSFRRLPPAAWSWDAWKGFYTELQHALGAGSWGYVANPAGGFVGFWWHFLGDDECEQYLQLEQDRFCFKIAVANPGQQTELGNRWQQRIVDECSHRGLPVKRPDRFGNGACMTVAILNAKWPVVHSDDLLDLTKTLELMKQAETVLDAAAGQPGV